MKEALTLQEKFLKDLYEVCKKYRVNINSSNIEMYYESDISGPLILEVEVTGAWKINKQNDAVVANEIKTIVDNSWTIKGDKE